MADSTVIRTFDPLSAASDAIGAYSDAKRSKELNDQAQAAANQKAAQDQSNADRTYQLRINEDSAADARAKAAAELAARQEADQALHQARVDALRAAQENERETNDARQFAINTKRINDAYALGLQKIKGAKDVAEIRAAATEQAANIRASATVQAANIHASATMGAAELREQGADRRADAKNDLSRQIFTQGDITKRRGQDLNAATRTDATNAAGQRAVAGAILRLSVQKGAPKPPTAQQDPKFAKAVELFYRDSPDDRARLIANPNVPQATREYLQALSGILGTQPDELPVPTDLGGGSSDEDDGDDDTP